MGQYMGSPEVVPEPAAQRQVELVAWTDEWPDHDLESGQLDVRKCTEMLL